MRPTSTSILPATPTANRTSTLKSASALGSRPGRAWRWAGAWLATCALAGTSLAATPPPAAEDPYLWLEEVQGERALAWARERSEATRARLRAWPGFEGLRQEMQELLDSTDRIPSVVRRGAYLYNFWQDRAQPRGVLRRTTLEQYRQREPRWETVLDLDALARREGENWVWGSIDCAGPAYRRCMVSLSRGGGDARVLREYDVQDKRFVEGGFQLPEAKSSFTWIDEDQAYVGTDFGPGSLTSSGYPRIIRRWQRGQPLQQAPVVFEGRAGDVSAWVSVTRDKGFPRTVFGRSVDFFRTEQFLLHDGTLRPIERPADSQLQFFRDQVLLTLRSPWQVGGTTWPAGTLLAAPANRFLPAPTRPAGGQPGSSSDAAAPVALPTPPFTALFTPSATRSLRGVATTGSTVLLNVLDNVAGRLEERRLEEGRWVERAVQAPFPATLTVQSLHDPLLEDEAWNERYLLGVSDFLVPERLELARTGSDSRELLKARPAMFDAQGMRAEQRFATSPDGTRVPYFVVWPRGAQADGRNPTLLYGYGGFRVPQLPRYSAGFGRAWLARGGVLVIANIRGGGEFGPAWHQAAVKAGKQKTHDDFAAVAEDLIRRGVTSPSQLGIQGGSQGGLLVGAVMLQRPELFGAVVCSVPLLDMKRYHLLLAGASWMAEYGNPDQPEEWAHIARYSPYQNVKPGVRLPPVLFTSSTRDDRVHPGHARKMAARMLEQGHTALYLENMEGGHAGAANHAQRAELIALEFAFLWQELSGRARLLPEPSRPAAR